jgi:hypothetical protein
MLKSASAARTGCLRPQAVSRRVSVRVRADKCLIVNTKGGGHAFIGLYLAKELVSKGHDVTIFQQGDEVCILQHCGVNGVRVSANCKVSVLDQVVELLPPAIRQVPGRAIGITWGV